MKTKAIRYSVVLGAAAVISGLPVVAGAGQLADWNTRSEKDLLQKFGMPTMVSSYEDGSRTYTYVHKHEGAKRHLVEFQIATVGGITGARFIGEPCDVDF